VHRRAPLPTIYVLACPVKRLVGHAHAQFRPAYGEAGSDPANPLLAEERALLVRSYASLLEAVYR
jgi:hypothetical protein